MREAFHKEGDLGLVAQSFAEQVPVLESVLTFDKVFAGFKHMQQSTGSDSVKRKKLLI